MKYILVIGGVILGIGKGVIVSSVGIIFKLCGLYVILIKIGFYINIDVGIFFFYEYGKKIVFFFFLNSNVFGRIC